MWQCRDRSEADTPLSVSTSPAPILCQEPGDSWILLKMLCYVNEASLSPPTNFCCTARQTAAQGTSGHMAGKC